MNRFKHIFFISIIILGFNEVKAQSCPPLTIPQTNNTGDGGTICFEGSPVAANPNRDICMENDEGFLKFYLNRALINSGSISHPNFSFDTSGFVIHGPNQPTNSNNFKELTFDFKGAGSAKIRAFRENSWGSSLQFLTNLNQGGNNPAVRMHINNDGKVGIGTTTPLKLLDVNGDATFCLESNSETDGKLVIRGANQVNTVNTTSPTNYRDLSFEFAYASTAVVRSFRGGAYDTYLQFLTTDLSDNTKTPKPRMHINHDGKVLIGDIDTYTKPGTYRLYVANGGILTDKVKVAIPGTSNWSDHVFEEDYELMPLMDVEQFVIKNKHLPNIPSAKELVTNGLDLAEMQSKQMEKIEELTLYMIEMKKEIEMLKKENEILKKKIKNN